MSGSSVHNFRLVNLCFKLGYAGFQLHTELILKGI